MKYKVIKIIYNKDNASSVIGETDDKEEVGGIIDNYRMTLQKDDKVKIEVRREVDNKLVGKTFIINKEFVPNMYLKNKIKQLFEKSGINKSELARRIGISYNSTRDLINREYLDNSNFVNILNTANALNVKVEDLFELEEMEK